MYKITGKHELILYNTIGYIHIYKSYRWRCSCMRFIFDSILYMIKKTSYSFALTYTLWCKDNYQNFRLMHKLS